jgi:D-xylose transport system substrate-binding protein
MVRSSVLKRLAAVSVMAMVAMTAAACGGNDSSTASGDGGSTTGSSSDVAVGVILPDATTSPRWEANDRPSLEAAFKAASVGYDIQNAQGDVNKFGQLCDQMIGEGVKVLMIVNLDQESGKACLDKATAAGVQSIDYDRLTPGGGASYYVSFDNVAVGGLMGTGLISALDAAGKTKANIVYVNGAATDNNAALFKSGYEAALKDKIDSGDYTLVGDQSGEWDATKAGNVFEQMYTDNGGKIDGAVVANDTMAGGVIARLKAAGAAGDVPVTGQDASVEGLQAVNARLIFVIEADLLPAVRAKALRGLAVLAIKHGDRADAERFLEESIDLSRGLGDTATSGTDGDRLPGRFIVPTAH